MNHSTLCPLAIYSRSVLGKWQEYDCITGMNYAHYLGSLSIYLLQLSLINRCSRHVSKCTTFTLKASRFCIQPSTSLYNISLYKLDNGNMYICIITSRKMKLVTMYTMFS